MSIHDLDARREAKRREKADIAPRQGEGIDEYLARHDAHMDPAGNIWQHRPCLKCKGASFSVWFCLSLRMWQMVCHYCGQPQVIDLGPYRGPTPPGSAA